jgi:DNA repair exonuclease SbcCD ATPase subunit
LESVESDVDKLAGRVERLSATPKEKRVLDGEDPLLSARSNLKQKRKMATWLTKKVGRLEDHLEDLKEKRDKVVAEAKETEKAAHQERHDAAQVALSALEAVEEALQDVTAAEKELEAAEKRRRGALNAAGARLSSTPSPARTARTRLQRLRTTLESM